MGLIFEKMCKEYLLRYAENLPFDLAGIGQWWGTDPIEKKQIQIDIVGVPVQEANQKVNTYLIGSCKFKNEKVDVDELELLKRYASAFAEKASFHYVIFSLGGFTDRLMQLSDQVQLITLADMY